MVSFLQSLLLLFHFCIFLSQLSELVWKLAEEISLQSASKCFQSFGPPANGNKSNAKKSRFCPNRNLTGTIYHWSVILRSFSVVLNSAKRDAHGFFRSSYSHCIFWFCNILSGLLSEILEGCFYLSKSQPVFDSLRSFVLRIVLWW